MQVTLKGYKQMRGVDGDMFRASILFDGKAVGTVMNDGWGGPNSYDLNLKNMTLLKVAAKNAGHDGIEGEDVFIEDLINDLDAEKTYKKLKKKGFKFTAYFIRDDWDNVLIGFNDKKSIAKELKDKRLKLKKIFGEEVANA